MTYGLDNVNYFATTGETCRVVTEPHNYARVIVYNNYHMPRCWTYVMNKIHSERFRYHPRPGSLCCNHYSVIDFHPLWFLLKSSLERNRMLNISIHYKPLINSQNVSKSVNLPVRNPLNFVGGRSIFSDIRIWSYLVLILVQWNLFDFPRSLNVPWVGKISQKWTLATWSNISRKFCRNSWIRTSWPLSRVSMETHVL